MFFFSIYILTDNLNMTPKKGEKKQIVLFLTHGAVGVLGSSDMRHFDDLLGNLT